LRKPVLVAGFEGWNDAGDAASDAAAWLTRTFDATRIASIDPEEHFDFQSRRPQVELVDGVTRTINWPANEFFSVHIEHADRDLVVLRGVEPSYRWKSFCRAALTVATETGCEMVVTLGALLADVPHTRQPRITGTATDTDLIERLALTRSRYEGPTGIVGVLHDAAREADIASASLWAPVPHYVATPPNPPATRALLERFGSLAGLSLELDGLDQLVDLWQRQVDHAIRDNDEVRTYVRELEARIDASEADELGVVIGEDGIPSADELVGEVEQFLREQEEEGGT
jgi:proteasome assembly chaperone (PAC2) family protein